MQPARLPRTAICLVAALWLTLDPLAAAASPGLSMLPALQQDGPVTFAAKFRELRNAGFRIEDVEGYTVGSGTRYAGIWVENIEGMAWAERRNMSSRAYGAWFQEMRSRGYRPVDIEGYERGGRLEYAAIWVRDGDARAWNARRNMSGSAFGDRFQTMRRNGYRIVDVEAYRSGDRLLWADIWVENTEDRPWREYRNLDDGGGADVPAEETGVRQSFVLMTYNVYMRPQPPFFDGQMKRAERIVPYLKGKGYDAVLFNELFGPRPRNHLKDALRDEFPFQTTVVGKAWEGRVRSGGPAVELGNGGVLFLSKWPIREEKERLFDRCRGNDCQAAKGVQYVRVEKEGRPYHVFGTHLQASCGRRDDPRWSVCQSQIRTIRDFIDDERIPDDEPVLIAGDLNVNREDQGGRLHRWMLAALDAMDPGVDHPTRDTERNELAHGNAQQYLDYVLVSENHLMPTRTTANTLRPRTSDPWRPQPLASPRRDLSDHYPVVGRFEFTFPSPR